MNDRDTIDPGVRGYLIDDIFVSNTPISKKIRETYLEPSSLINPQKMMKMKKHERDERISQARRMMYRDYMILKSEEYINKVINTEEMSRSDKLQINIELDKLKILYPFAGTEENALDEIDHQYEKIRSIYIKYTKSSGHSYSPMWSPVSQSEYLDEEDKKERDSKTNRSCETSCSIF